MTGEQAAFGAELRRERECRGISLIAVAESTKIQQSLLASLEQGDASHWPAGIYRRAFVREYASAIGLSPETILAEFVRLFPEGDIAGGERIAPIDGDRGLRLTFAKGARWTVRPNATRTAAALTDAGAVLMIATALGNLFGAAFWIALAIAAMAYYSLATMLLGRSPVLWLIDAVKSPRLTYPTRPEPARLSSRELLHIVTATARLPQTAAEQDFAHAAENARVASR